MPDRTIFELLELPADANSRDVDEAYQRRRNQLLVGDLGTSGAELADLDRAYAWHIHLKLTRGLDPYRNVALAVDFGGTLWGMRVRSRGGDTPRAPEWERPGCVLVVERLTAEWALSGHAAATREGWTMVSNVQATSSRPTLAVVIWSSVE